VNMSFNHTYTLESRFLAKEVHVEFGLHELLPRQTTKVTIVSTSELTLSSLRIKCREIENSLPISYVEIRLFGRMVEQRPKSAPMYASYHYVPPTKPRHIVHESATANRLYEDASRRTARMKNLQDKFDKDVKRTASKPSINKGAQQQAQVYHYNRFTQNTLKVHERLSADADRRSQEVEDKRKSQQKRTVDLKTVRGNERTEILYAMAVKWNGKRQARNLESRSSSKLSRSATSPQPVARSASPPKLAAAARTQSDTNIEATPVILKVSPPKLEVHRASFRVKETTATTTTTAPKRLASMRSNASSVNFISAVRIDSDDD